MKTQPSLLIFITNGQINNKYMYIMVTSKFLAVRQKQVRLLFAHLGDSKQTPYRLATGSTTQLVGGGCELRDKRMLIDEDDAAIRTNTHSVIGILSLWVFQLTEHLLSSLKTSVLSLTDGVGLQWRK